MTKSTRAQYTLEFKQEAVRLVESGQSIAAASRSLGVVEQTLFNWVKAKREGRLKGASSGKAVSAERERYANHGGVLLRGRNRVKACDSSHVADLPLVGQPIG